MHSRPHIRAASQTDAAQIAEIYAHHVAHGTASFDTVPRSVDDTIAKIEDCHARGWPFLVATDRTMVLGYAYASPFRTRPAYRWMIEDSVYVAPEAKGKGIGKALLQVLLSECEKLGFHQMTAVIGDGEGNRGSVALHESLGFKHSGTIEASGFKHGRWINTVIMQISLNGGNAKLPDEVRFPASDWKGLK